MLRIENLSAWYGEAQVLREVQLEIAAGEVVTLCGRNGAGKTTLLRCVMGLHTAQQGIVRLAGKDLTGVPAFRRARLGLGWVPDDRGSYATLTVAEHLALPKRVNPQTAWSTEQVYEAFPHLYAR